jgi:hypothetical protein
LKFDQGTPDESFDVPRVRSSQDVEGNPQQDEFQYIGEHMGCWFMYPF